MSLFHYKKIKNNAYELIDIQALLNEMIKPDNLYDDFFEKLKKEGHQYIINVRGSVNLSFEEKKHFKKYVENLQIKSKNFIPFKFHHIDEIFDCNCNLLENVQNAPAIVIGSFDCSYNQLISLKSKLNSILGHFNCSYNQLSSLKHCPEKIRGNFDCSKNQIISLEYFPNMVDGLIILKHSNFASILNQIGYSSLDKNYLNNEKILQIKYESNDINIQNMSDDYFFFFKIFNFGTSFI